VLVKSLYLWWYKPRFRKLTVAGSPHWTPKRTARVRRGN